MRIYVCGPTVYDFAHIGNARPVIVFDVLFRLLRHVYGADHVVYARNVTDVDDKINARALERGITIRDLTDGTLAQFRADVDALGCLRPTHEPRATDYIEEMKAIIERLSGARRRLCRRGARAVLGRRDGRSPGRAALWLARAPLARRDAGRRPRRRRALQARPDGFRACGSRPSADQPGWPSPAGIATPGRPGWHIECSAMSMAKLLDPFGGGLPATIRPRTSSTFMAAASISSSRITRTRSRRRCCALGTPRMANIWMHNGFLQVEGQKMSKSLGNFVTIDELAWDTVLRRPGLAWRRAAAWRCCAPIIASRSTGR